MSVAARLPGALPGPIGESDNFVRLR